MQNENYDHYEVAHSDVYDGASGKLEQIKEFNSIDLSWSEQVIRDDYLHNRKLMAINIVNEDPTFKRVEVELEDFITIYDLHLNI